MTCSSKFLIVILLSFISREKLSQLSDFELTIRRDYAALLYKQPAMCRLFINSILYYTNKNYNTYILNEEAKGYKPSTE